MMEFPYLQAAYETAPESLELIALNPMDATDETLSAFAKENGYTIPFVCADTMWIDRMGNPSYPTTVVIDRYGTVAMVHRGYITENGVFEKIFEYFTAEDYTRTVVTSYEDIM